MEKSEVYELAQRGLYDDTPLRGRIEETHISWVILTGTLAIKIKKPVKLSFLDFSTLSLRKQLCEKELWLNSRFSGIYLAVLPIRFTNGKWIIGGDSEADIVDYCVVMKRMSVAKRLDNVLKRDGAKKKSISALARKVAEMHSRANKTFIPFEIGRACDLFNDIGSIVGFAAKHIDVQFSDIIWNSIEWSDSFLKDHSERFKERISLGLQRDVHGDLHSGNIFLYSKPVLFDCIEFNDTYRQIDVLYEVAFLCMDFERFRQPGLADIFLNEYKKHCYAFQDESDHALFVYYKALRANVRAKVHALQWEQSGSISEASHHVDETRKYLRLLNGYVVGMRAMSSL